LDKNIISLSIGNGIAQLISFTTVIITARIFSQSDFGDLAVVVGIAGILRVLLTLRYETLIVPSKTISISAKVALSCLLIAAALAILISIVNIILIKLFALYSIFLSTIIAFCLALQLVTENFLNKSKRYKNIIFIKIFQSLSIGIFAVLFGYLSISSGLIFGQLVGVLLSSMFSIFFIRDIFKYSRDLDLPRFLIKNKQTPKFLVPASLIESINEQGTIILIATLFLSEIAGFFSLSWRMVVVPISVISAAFSLIYFERLSSLYNSKENISKVLISAWIKLLFFSLLVGILVYFFIDEFIITVLGEEWRRSAEIISIIIFLIMARFVSSPTSNIFIILKKLNINLVFSISNLFLRFSSIYIGYLMNDFYLGIKIWVIGEISLIAIYNLYAYYRSKEYEKKYIKEN